MFRALRSKRKSTTAKILVVDDEPDCLTIIECRLQWCQYKVIMATNGEEGLQIAENEKPDLVLLDTNMPIVNGREMLERMRQSPILKDTPVIMVTALSEREDIAAASALGIAGYITKPIDFTSLLEKISTVLQKRMAKSV